MNAAATNEILPYPVEADADWCTQDAGLVHRQRTLQELADGLRAEGHAVYARCAARCDGAVPDPMLAAVEILGRVLTTRAASSGRCYLRLYQSADLLFVELTRLAPTSFNETIERMSGRRMIDMISRWAAANQHMLSVRRGPKGQLRVAVMMRPRSAGDRSVTTRPAPGGATAAPARLSESWW